MNKPSFFSRLFRTAAKAEADPAPLTKSDESTQTEVDAEDSKLVRDLLDRSFKIGLNLAQPKKKYTTIHEAIEANDVQGVQDLLDQGVDPCQRDDYERTPLGLAVKKNFPDIITVLVKAGVPVDYRNDENNTSLYVAVEGGKLQSVNVLLAAGADINAHNRTRRTALHMAVDLYSWYPEMVACCWMLALTWAPATRMVILRSTACKI
jgi:ankyrin repeat protein